ncbi:MAG: cation-transporting P-type ATPase [Acidobacteria bacterium]|nr:cation-transporting P-type ATPase [Acidobacteriota bacterium]
MERAGPNELETEAATPAWRRLLAQFKDALVLLLVAAALVSCTVCAVERDTSEALEHGLELHEKCRPGAKGLVRGSVLPDEPISVPNGDL